MYQDIFPKSLARISLEKFTTHLYFKLFDYFRKNFRKIFYSVIFKVIQPQNIRPQEKIYNFAFKNSNIVIGEIIQKRRDYFL